MRHLGEKRRSTLRFGTGLLALLLTRVGLWGRRRAGSKPRIQFFLVWRFSDSVCPLSSNVGFVGYRTRIWKEPESSQYTVEVRTFESPNQTLELKDDRNVNLMRFDSKLRNLVLQRCRNRTSTSINEADEKDHKSMVSISLGSPRRHTQPIDRCPGSRSRLAS